MSIHIRIGKEKLLLLLYFAGIIFVGSLLLALPFATGSGGMRYIDALFTATSAVCVTGLTVVDTYSELTRAGQTVLILIIQLGGLGIIAFSTLYLFLPRRRISIVTRGLTGDYTVPSFEFRTRKIIAQIVTWTMALELVGALIIWPTLSNKGYSFFDSMFHAVSAFCNAGFSTLRSGMQSFRDNVMMNIVTMILIVAGGLGFIVLQDIARFVRRKKFHLTYHSSVVLRTSAALIVVGAALFFVLEYNHAYSEMSSGSKKIMASFFQSVTSRTAGFDTVNQAKLSSMAHFVTIILMFIGASPASTGGGVKTTTFYLMLLTALRFREGGGVLVDRNRSIMPSSIFKAAAIVVRAVLIVLVVTAVLLIAEQAHDRPIGIEAAVFESVSAFGTVGLSIGITPTLSDISKFALISAMFMGRVGLFAMAIPPSRLSAEPYTVAPKADILL
ncbi:MAG: potassium transporter TrkG [Rectinema sp.]